MSTGARTRATYPPIYRDLRRAASGGANNRRATLAAAFSIVLCFAPGVGLAQNQAMPLASFAVGATVLPRVGIVARSVPATLEVLPSDVDRGFVDVPVTIQFEVTSTGTAGFALDFWPTSTAFAAMFVRGIGAEAAIDASGGTIVQRGRRGFSMPLQLGFRFNLARGTTPGRYPWPVHVDARSLSTA